VGRPEKITFGEDVQLGDREKVHLDEIVEEAGY
jgi:hypothetical protein